MESILRNADGRWDQIVYFKNYIAMTIRRRNDQTIAYRSLINPI